MIARQTHKGWKYYFWLYVVLVVSEWAYDLSKSQWDGVAIIGVTYALLFAWLVYCYAFGGNVFVTVAKLFFYVGAGVLLYLVAGSGNGSLDWITGVMTLAIYLPGFVAIRRLFSVNAYAQ